MKSNWKITTFIYVCSFLGSFISATIQHQSRLPVLLGASQRTGLCPTIRIGQDDLPGFDLISQFQIEKAASQGIIQRVVGSTSLQVAYKLGPNVDFRIPTSAIYSHGLPDEYSFLSTFRMTGATLQKYWTIWQIQDASGKEQVGVNLNGQMKSVEFSYKGADGILQTASFLHLPFLFDSQWHKLMISVEANSVTLFIDCIKIESLSIKPKARISTDGFAVLGKLKNNPHISVPVVFSKDTDTGIWTVNHQSLTNPVISISKLTVSAVQEPFPWPCSFDLAKEGSVLRKEVWNDIISDYI